MEVYLLSYNVPNLKLDSNELQKHIYFTFLVDGISRACSHQLVRHRLASYSQQSQRYVSMKDFPYVKPSSLEGVTVDIDGESYSYDDLMKLIGKVYEAFVNLGVPKEDARFILPNGCATRIVFTMNGRELIHFLKLRTCNRAQWEIRDMAVNILKILRDKFPEIFKNVGPSCFMEGICPEGKKSCGKKDEVVEFFREF